LRLAIKAILTKVSGILFNVQVGDSILAVEKLLQGYRNFRDGRFLEQHELFQGLLTNGQSPEVMMISCCDSRMDPTIIMEAQPGSFFMIRNVANLVPPYHPDGAYHGTSAALEFGVKQLKVSDIVVFGHAQCGGISALYEGVSEVGGGTDFIGQWMKIADDARDEIRHTCAHESRDVQLRKMEQEGIRLSLRNLLTFEWISTAVAAGNLKLHGWYFDLKPGILFTLDPDRDVFVPVI
jgi:carbonic anhydrase